MFGGFGYAKVFGYVKSRKKDKEIKYLKGELAAVREKVKRPTPTSAPKDAPKKIEGIEGNS
jgi:hypothetical protein